MKKKTVMILILLFLVVVGGLVAFFMLQKTKEEEKTKKADEKELLATVIQVDQDTFTIQDAHHLIYSFPKEEYDFVPGDVVILKPMENIDPNKMLQEQETFEFEKVTHQDTEQIPELWQDQGIFQDSYEKAYQKLNQMTTDEKIAQILLVRYPDVDPVDTLKTYQFGGYVFYGKDFKEKTTEEVQTMIQQLQDVSKIPILTAVDEEGGTVVRVSSNPKLAPARFQSPRVLYQEGGFDRIREDTIEKNRLLENLGINLNLAPVVDVSTNPNDYMYERTLGENTELTSTYAETVISASKESGVSYTLKHFPGYGNNTDTHTGIALDQRTREEIIQNDLPPFQAGIKANAEAILISHNTVTSIDDSNPASLSFLVHNLLRDKLQFTGIIMTDDLEMGAVSQIEDATLKAVLAGNDLIITTDYEASIQSIKKALEDHIIDESLIDKLAFRVISWKYEKSLL